MVEQIFKLTRDDKKAVEKVIFDENVHYLHMVFNKNEGLPEHLSNSNVYMTVVRGMLSIGLNDQDIHEYEAGTLLKIPFQTKMNVNNLHDETLELTGSKESEARKIVLQSSLLCLCIKGVHKANGTNGNEVTVCILYQTRVLLHKGSQSMIQID